MSSDLGPIAILTPRYAPAIGGVERVAEMQARELQRRGLAVQIVTTDPEGKHPAVEHRDGVLVRRFPTVAHDGVYFVSPALGRWLSAHAHEFALLHAHSYHTPIALQAAMASRARRIPLVVTPHYHGTGHSFASRLLHLPYRPFGRWMLGHARFIMCVSTVEQHLLWRHFGTALRTTVVPNGIDAAELENARLGRQPERAAAGPLILTVGRLDSYKRIGRLVDALQHLAASAELVVVGDGPRRSFLERRAVKLGVERQVRFLGHLSRAELLAQYAAADVFASLSAHEAFGLAVLEAGVAGLPVLVSDIPAHREVAGYLAPGRATFVSPAASAVDIARHVATAAAQGRADNVASWPLPTWSKHVEAAIACYASALGVHT